MYKLQTKIADSFEHHGYVGLPIGGPTQLPIGSGVPKLASLRAPAAILIVVVGALATLHRAGRLTPPVRSGRKHTELSIDSLCQPRNQLEGRKKSCVSLRAPRSAYLRECDATDGPCQRPWHFRRSLAKTKPQEEMIVTAGNWRDPVALRACAPTLSIFYLILYTTVSLAKRLCGLEMFSQSRKRVLSKLGYIVVSL